ncbi:MAG: DUF5677 domain-containing protein [Thermoleophilia bacterium]
MWEYEGSYQRILDHELADVPYRIAATVITEKLAAMGIPVGEEERENLFRHLKDDAGDSFSFDDGMGNERTEVRITAADLARIDGRLDTFMTEGVSAIVDDVGDKASELILASLRESWALEQERQLLERDGFRDRLHGRWGEGIDLLRMLLTVSREFGDLVNTTLRRCEQTESPVLCDVLLRLHARACQVTDEIICLLAEGFSDGAMARWRTLHEIAAVALFLRHHGELVAQRYVDHEAVESARAVRDYDECREKLGYERMSDAELAATRRRHAELVAKYGADFDRQYGWAADALGLKDPKFRDIREDAGIDHMRAHYRLASHNVHANPKGVLFKLGLLGDTDLLLAGPSNAGMSDPGQNAGISLTQVSSALGAVAPTLDTIIVLRILNRVTQQTCEAFHEASVRLACEAAEEM